MKTCAGLHTANGGHPLNSGPCLALTKHRNRGGGGGELPLEFPDGAVGGIFVGKAAVKAGLRAVLNHKFLFLSAVPRERRMRSFTVCTRQI